MPFKFNPFTGTLDLVNTSTGGSSTDHHASWKEIQTSQTVTVSQYKQMIVFGEFIQDGTLYVDGDLILED